MTSSGVQDVHRSNQAWFERVCERETLDFGIAFYTDRYGEYGGANQLREVVLDEVGIEGAWEGCEGFYETKGTRCRRWVPAIAQAPEALESFLGARGFERVDLRVMNVSSWVEIGGGEEFRVVPARAVRAAYETFCGAWGGLALDRLDDPGLEMSVVIVGPPVTEGPTVVGRLGFFQIGDVGRVRELKVSAEYGERGVERALMRHVLGFARRMSVRSVCAEVRAGDAELMALHRVCGFADCGSTTRFER